MESRPWETVTGVLSRMAPGQVVLTSKAIAGAAPLALDTKEM
jgi:hypothetical protein